MKEGVVHLPKLLVSVLVVSPDLGGILHPLVKVLTLMMVILSMSCLKYKQHTRALM